MTKHVVHSVKVEQPKIIKSTTQRKESIWRSQSDDNRSRKHRECEEENESAEKETRSRQRTNSLLYTPRAHRSSTLTR